MNDRIWVAVHPGREGTRVIATDGVGATLLKARLAAHPWHQRALPSLLEALAFWQKQAVHAVLAVDVQDVRFGGTFLHELDETHARTPLYSIDLVDGRRRPRRAGDRIDGIGDFRDLRQIMLTTVPR
jgi:hypothetical protein